MPAGSAAESPATSPSDPYAAYEFPAITDDWGASEYAKVRDVLVEIERKQPELLVTLAGPKGEVLTRVASLDAIAKAVAAASDDAMFEIIDAIGAIYKLYANRVAHQQPYGPEYLLVTAAILRALTVQFARMTTVIDEAMLRAEPVRREGLLKMRHGLFIVYVGALEAPLVAPTIVDASTAVAQLGAVTADVAPFLLPDERQTIDQFLASLAGTGAVATQIAAMRASIAALPLHPLVAAFADEAQQFSAEQRELYADVAEQQLPAVELGPEPGGVRYAFPDAGFSAVFHQQPNAMLTVSNATDGVPITARVLGTRDAIGYTTAIVCMSRPTPLASDDQRSFARKVLEDAKLTDIHEVMIDRRRGLEGVFSGPISRALMRAVELDRGGCMITVEYPPQLAASYEQQARAFLDSVRLGDFEG